MSAASNDRAELPSNGDDSDKSRSYESERLMAEREARAKALVLVLSGLCILGLNISLFVLPLPLISSNIFLLILNTLGSLTALGLVGWGYRIVREPDIVAKKTAKVI